MTTFEKVLKTIRDHQLIEKHQHIVLGLSGGPDSLCLFHILLRLAEDWDLTVYPVHVNHKLRPGAAEADQRFVEDFCLQAGSPARVYVYDCGAIAAKERLTSEEAGRKVRYEAFAREAAELRSKGVRPEDIRIAVAQNADDQAETILFRVLRGAGTDGLSGISYSRFDEEENRIVRPLLDIYKEEILAYCRENQLRPCVDATNQEPLYTRNRLRLQLIPLLEQEYNANIKDTLNRMGKIAARDSQFLWSQAKQAYDRLCLEQTPAMVTLEGDGLRKLDPALRQRVLSLAFQQVGLTEDVSYAHYESCEAIVFHAGPSAGCDLPDGYRFVRVYGDVRVASKAYASGEAESSEVRIRVVTAEEYSRLPAKKGGRAAFDLDALEAVYGEHAAGLLCIRTRQPGDFIALGGGGRKKLQDLFVDRKVPRDDRDRILLAAVGSEVLWVLPVQGWSRYSGKYSVEASTKKVIYIEKICDMC